MCPTTERDLADGIGDAGPRLAPRQRQPRRHRPLRGGARGRAQPAAEDRAPRPLHGAGAAARRDQPRLPRLGRRGPHRARRARRPRHARPRRRRAWRPPSPTRCSSRSCSPRPPPTSRSVDRADASADRQHRHAGHQRPRARDDHGRRAGLRRRPRRLGGPRASTPEAAGTERFDAAGPRRDPGLRRQPRPSRLRRRPRAGVRRADGGPPVHRGRHQDDGQGDARGHRRAARRRTSTGSIARGAALAARRPSRPSRATG